MSEKRYAARPKPLPPEISSVYSRWISLRNYHRYHRLACFRFFFCARWFSSSQENGPSVRHRSHSAFAPIVSELIALCDRCSSKMIMWPSIVTLRWFVASIIVLLISLVLPRYRIRGFQSEGQGANDDEKDLCVEFPAYVPGAAWAADDSEG